MARLEVRTTVERWDNAEGWGVLTATAETPGGISAPFFAIQMEGFKTLRSGQEVEAIVDEREQRRLPMLRDRCSPGVMTLRWDNVWE